MALPPVGGGGGDVGIPGSFTITGHAPNLLIQSSTQVVNATTVYALETVYAIPYQFTIPTKEWLADGPQYEGGIRANGIEAMAQHAHVTGLSYTQDVNNAGALIDQMIVTVGTDDGSSEAEFTWPLLELNSVAAFAMADKVWQRLVDDQAIT